MARVSKERSILKFNSPAGSEFLNFRILKNNFNLSINSLDFFVTFLGKKATEGIGKKYLNFNNSYYNTFMKIIFLIPPSEGKNPDGKPIAEKLTYIFDKPVEIAKNASEKDMKCSGNRFAEAIFLNENIEKSVTLPATDRYNGVMFSAINYATLSAE